MNPAAELQVLVHRYRSGAITVDELQDFLVSTVDSVWAAGEAAQSLDAALWARISAFDRGSHVEVTLAQELFALWGVAPGHQMASVFGRANDAVGQSCSHSSRLTPA